MGRSQIKGEDKEGLRKELRPWILFEIN